ncbi:DUF4179 domain-containing protein [Paenibacillus chartarius]|uniref:DUF4179 domain-containing protein n=1 Tax=Paenibacillus chartarius TaxID=747481 RepID=A0ABV6DSX1_9BACL
MTIWKRTETKKVHRKAEGGNQREDNNWEDALFPHTLSDEFTDRVMLALEGTEIEQAQGAGTHSMARESGNINPFDTSIAAQVKRSLAAKRSSHLKFWGATAAVVVLAGSTLLYTQPTLAEMVRSLFAKDSIVDNGMKHVKETGLVQISGVSATDHGYMLKVNEVIADSTRLIIGVDVYDDKGNVQIGEIDYASADFNVYFIDNGNFADVSYDMRQGGNRTTNKIEFIFMRPVLADKLQLNVHIKELSLYKDKLNEGPPIKKIQGDWTMKMGIDLTEAKAQTLLTAINQTYVTPGGIEIHMQGASRTPSGGSLEFTTKLTPDAAGRAVDGQSGFHKLNFHLEDEQGNVIGDSILFELRRRSELERWSGVTQWFYQFNHFDYDKQKIRFVLNSYEIRENNTASVTFDPAQTTAEHPAIFEDSGDKLLLQGLQIGPYPDNSLPDQVRATIPLGGMVNNDISRDAWVAIDENGKEYSVLVGGGVSADKAGTVYLNDNYFVIHDLDIMPKQLTLKRSIVHHLYKDADWSFVIPQTGTIGVIPE